MAVTLKVNGIARPVEAESDKPLLWVLREDIGLTGTRFGCGAGLCGACTVHIDGQPARSCLTTLGDAAGAEITTIEGIAATEHGRRITQSWIRHQVPQCGYCQSGQMMSATALLAQNSSPTDEDIDAAMAGNLCRCATYRRIRTAIKAAARAGGQ